MQLFRELLRWFGRSGKHMGQYQAHMTFGKRTLSRSMTQARTLLKEQLWIWPILAVAVLALVGYGVNQAIKETIETSLKSQLQTLLGIETSMIDKWMLIQQDNARSLANSQGVRNATFEILNALGPPPATGSATSDTQKQQAVGPESVAELRARLDQELQPGMSSQRFCGYVLADRDAKIIASSSPELIGQDVPQYESALNRAIDGETVVSTPFASIVFMKDESGRMRTGAPTMFACAPVRDQNLQVVAVLAMRIRPESEFTKILQLGQLGRSGETFAFDKDGLMVSNSRFDEELMLLGLIPDIEGTRSILTVSLRDPGGDLEAGFRPTVRRAELPLVDSVAQAIEGNSGVNVAGYRNYRGSVVVGAWQWLPNVSMGVTTELKFDEAFRPLTILRRTFYTLFGLLVLSSIAIFGFTLSISRLRREAQKAAIEARQLGQYELLQQIGSGAMGVVYKGQHAMMQRATAIKLLNVENVNESSIERFEREVQLTCKLNHPSTIAIYDFGRTPEGVFYYAMEYLDGITLQSLVEDYGRLPEERAIHILKQVCGSLFEAHSLGLVHRDIKPANIMLNRRGGEADVVKVLDFGLVKAVDEHAQNQKAGGLFGTPLYMSPEAIQTPDLVDARSDLYALGAVGYFLITGQPVFNTLSLTELCRFHVTAIPTPPSEVATNAVSQELESAIMGCLEKDRSKRPQTARELIHMLSRSPRADDWSLEDGDAWWGRHVRTHQTGLTSQPTLGANLAAVDTKASASNRQVGIMLPPSAAKSAPATPANPGDVPATTSPPESDAPARGFDRTINF